MRVFDLDTWLVRRRWPNCPHCAVGTFSEVWGLLCLLFGWFASASDPFALRVASVGLVSVGFLAVSLGTLIFLADSHDLGRCTP
jgi:hypothetical protein